MKIAREKPGPAPAASAPAANGDGGK